MKKQKEPTLSELKVKVEKTTTYKKHLNYVKDLLQKPSFQKKVRDIRSKHRLAPLGIKIGKRDPRKSEKYKALYDSFDWDALRKDILAIARSYAIPGWDHVLLQYVLHNDIDCRTNFAPQTFDVIDLRFCMIGPYKTNKERETAFRYLKEIPLTLPVAILISPYASETEVVDYIKKLFKTEIRPKQDLYREKGILLGKVRSKSKRVQERNDYIYKNKEVPIMKLVSLVNDKFNENLEYPYLRRIIKSEIRKRSVHG